MKKQKLTLGFWVCIFLSFLAVSMKSIENTKDFGLKEVVKSTVYMLGFSGMCLMLHNCLVQWVVVKFPTRKSQLCASIFTITLVGVSMFPYYHMFHFLMDLLHINQTKWNMNEEHWGGLMFIRGVTISSLLFFVVFYLQLLQEKQNRILEIEQLKQAQLEANLSNLKEQLNPHFLFNTLNTLSSLTVEEIVKDYVAELADVYRYMLVHNKMSTVSLQMELKFVNSYIYIMKTRMGEKMQIDINIDSQLLTIQMPPMTLQLLIENAIKHNVASNSNPLHIKIYNQNKQSIIVENNYNPKKQIQASTGIGLANLMKRYKLLFNNEIEILPNPNFFIVKIPINKP